MHQVGEWISQSGRTVTEVARFAGLSRSTITRITAGQVSPNWTTLREIALACGHDIAVATVAVSDPDAAQAARFLLEEGFAPDDAGACQEWVERIRRRGLAGPVDTVAFGGACATPLHRAGARFFSGSRPEWKAASAGSASGQEWALSGAPLLGVAGTVVVHARDETAVTTLLTDSMQQLPSAEGADLVVLPATTGTFYDSWTQDGFTLAAPIQGLLDCIGLGGELAQAAIAEARTW